MAENGGKKRKESAGNELVGGGATRKAARRSPRSRTQAGPSRTKGRTTRRPARSAAGACGAVFASGRDCSKGERAAWRSVVERNDKKNVAITSGSACNPFGITRV